MTQMDLNPDPRKLKIETAFIKKAAPKLREAPVGLRIYTDHGLLPDDESIMEVEVRFTTLPTDYILPGNKHEFFIYCNEWQPNKGIVEQDSWAGTGEGCGLMPVVPPIESLFFVRIRITDRQGAVTLWTDNQIYVFTSEFECVRIGGHEEWTEWWVKNHPGNGGV